MKNQSNYSYVPGSYYGMQPKASYYPKDEANLSYLTGMPTTAQPNYRQLNRIVNPIIARSMSEVQSVGIEHAIKEVALVSYLVGTGLDINSAYKLVESMEVNETFPGYGMNFYK